MDVMQEIYRLGIVPVAVLPDPACAVPLAKALREGLLPCVEVTFRTAGAAEAIAAIRQAEPEVLVGAGTVLTVEQAKAAIAAGAQFLVAPGLNEEVVECAKAAGVPMLPGCATATEIEKAMGMGLETVKFFPAQQAGGADYLKALSGPYKQMKFVPTGGIHAENLQDYLKLPNVLACGGSWMVPGKCLQEGNYAEITRLCKQAVDAMLELRLSHVGVNAKNEEEALTSAKLLEALLGIPVISKPSSVWSGNAVEWMKGDGLGDCGHIGFHVSNVVRGAAWLERKGIPYLKDSLRPKEGSKPGKVYLKDTILGFAVHFIDD